MLSGEIRFSHPIELIKNTKQGKSKDNVPVWELEEKVFFLGINAFLFYEGLRFKPKGTADDPGTGIYGKHWNCNNL